MTMGHESSRIALSRLRGGLNAIESVLNSARLARGTLRRSKIQIACPTRVATALDREMARPAPSLNYLSRRKTARLLAARVLLFSPWVESALQPDSGPGRVPSPGLIVIIENEKSTWSIETLFERA